MESDSGDGSNNLESDSAEDKFEYELELELPMLGARGVIQNMKKKRMCGIPDCEPCNRLDCTTCKGCLQRRRCLLRYCPEYAKKTGAEPPSPYALGLKVDPPVPGSRGTMQNMRKKKMCGIPDCEPCNRLDCTTCKGCANRRRCLLRFCPEYAKKIKANRPSPTKKVCPDCGTSYASRGNLNRHRMTEGACERNLTLAQDSKEEILANQCPDCGTSYSSRANLRRHQAGFCKGMKDPKEELMATFCDDCGTIYSSKPNLRRHKLTCKGIKDPQEEGIATKCPDCGSSYSSKANLRRHRLGYCKGMKEELVDFREDLAQCIEVTPTIDETRFIKEEADDDHHDDHDDDEDEMFDDTEVTPSLEPEIRITKREVSDSELYGTESSDDRTKEVEDNDISDDETYRTQATPVSEDELKDAEETTEDRMQETDPLDIDTEALTQSEESIKSVRYECNVCSVKKSDKKLMKRHLLTHFHVLVKCVNS